MEGRRESKYNISGTCPECGKLIRVEHTISVDLVELGKTTKTEGKDGKNNTVDTNGETSKSESAGVRPAEPKGPTGTESKGPKSTDPKKDKRAKNAGGK